jgi:hypothetical protein
MRGMDLVPTDLTAAARAARGRLAELSRAEAVAGASPGAAGDAGAMAAAAREAIFADAVFGALHARFEELKSVAR